ncbi:hypothetical protein DJ82_11970 [Halorubrum sp. Ib24]|nr:hypothetical protein DJ82_11970 [Halorubrum sp. Ib24]
MAPRRHPGLEDPVVAVALGPVAGEEALVVRPHQRDAVDGVVVDREVRGRDAELGLPALVREGAHALAVRPVGRVERQDVGPRRVRPEAEDRGVRSARRPGDEDRWCPLGFVFRSVTLSASGSLLGPVAHPGFVALPGSAAAPYRSLADGAVGGRVADRPLVRTVRIRGSRRQLDRFADARRPRRPGLVHAGTRAPPGLRVSVSRTYE